MFSTDPTSAFGGIIALNRELDHDTAKLIIDKQFVEVIVAPTISNAAKELLQTKKNMRVLQIGELNSNGAAKFDFKKVSGGLLTVPQSLDALAGIQKAIANRIVI